MSAKNVAIIGAPSAHGGPHAGPSRGPARMRAAKLEQRLALSGCDVNDFGDVFVPPQCRGDLQDPRLRNLHSTVAVAKSVARAVTAARAQRRFPLTIGGDHSVSLGSIEAAAHGRSIGLIWIDAHADFNTEETTSSGNIHGMPLAALVGRGRKLRAALGHGTTPLIDPQHVALLGARDFDPGERETLQREGVSFFALEDLERNGPAVLARVVDVVSRARDGVYLSFDLDVIDPRDAPGVSTRAAYGMSTELALQLCSRFARNTNLVGADIVELNPALDHQGRTARTAVRLACAVASPRRRGIDRRWRPRG